MERRDYHRMRVAVPMSFRIPPREEMISSLILDISGTGISFLTAEEVSVRQELLLYLSLPRQRTIEVHAHVIWVKKEGASAGLPQYRVGIQIDKRIKFDEKEFVKFYADKLIEVFGVKLPGGAL